MIRVTVDLIPYGYQPPETVAQVDIGNDGTGNHEVGNYQVWAETLPPQKDNRLRLVAPVGKLFGKFGGFPRQDKNALYLVRDALDAVLKDKQTNYDRVVEFMEAYDQPIATRPDLVEQALANLRLDLISEEYEELCDAVTGQDIVGIADALADLLYVIYGAAATWGIPIQRVFEEVHRSNMTKLGADGKPVLREDGKVTKGPNYEPPRIAEVMVG